MTLTLGSGVEDVTAPGGVVEVLKALLLNVVDNPIKALFNANYIGILSWALMLGFTLKNAAASTKLMLSNVSDALTEMVRIVIAFAPLGIMGLVFDVISTSGIGVLLGYGKLLAVLIGCMLFVALVVNPIIVYIYIRSNPFPLVFRCLRGKWHHCFLHTKFGCEHSCQHDPLRGPWIGQGHVFGFHSAWCNDQYGRCGGDDFRPNLGGSHTLGILLISVLPSSSVSWQRSVLVEHRVLLVGHCCLSR